MTSEQKSIEQWQIAQNWLNKMLTEQKIIHQNGSWTFIKLNKEWTQQTIIHQKGNWTRIKLNKILTEQI